MSHVPTDVHIVARPLRWLPLARKHLYAGVVVVSVTAWAGHRWGGWWAAAVAGGVALAVALVALFAEYRLLSFVYHSHPFRSPPRGLDATVRWAANGQAIVGAAAVGYLSGEWVGAITVGAVAAVAFALAAVADRRWVRGVRAGVPAARHADAQPGATADDGA